MTGAMTDAIEGTVEPPLQSSSRSCERLAAEVTSRVFAKGDGLSVQEVNERLDKMAKRSDPGESMSLKLTILIDVSR